MKKKRPSGTRTRATSRTAAAGSRVVQRTIVATTVAKLSLSKTISEEEALGASTNPGDLKLLLKGVLSSGTATQRATEARPALKITKGF